MTRLIKLMSAEAEIQKIEAEAERRKAKVRADLAEAIAGRKVDIGEIAGKVGALTLPDELIGGALLLAIDALAAGGRDVDALSEPYAARFPESPKSKRGRKPKPKPGTADAGAAADATMGEVAETPEPQAAG